MRPDLPALFSELADLSAKQRDQYYAEYAVDADSRRELERLFEHDHGTVDPVSQLVGVASRAWLNGDATGLRCGAFRLLSVLGSGGMGVVYLAERADGEVRQRAAVKLMQRGWSELQRERFLQEREILAALSHPNIAHLLDAGHLNDGQPYLAMEYVEGRRIDEYCQDLGMREKLELFLKVCGAVEYLHTNSVLHRDLKPGNILVTGLGEPKLLDFGIARIVDLQREATLTEVRMLTPDYASPEQLSGRTAGPSSDIYSLGAVLYSLLAGKPPRGMQDGEVSTEIKGDLELVLRTTMRPDPQDRYACVSDFIEDLRAVLESRPVRARRRDWVYRARMLVRRQPVSVALSGVLLAGSAMTAGIWYQQLRPTTTIPELRSKRLTSNTPELPIGSAAISPDGKVVAYTDPLGVHYHDLASGETRLLSGTGGHVLLQWLPDGSGVETRTLDEAGRVVTAMVSADGSVKMRTAVSERYKLSPDGGLRARLATGPLRLVVEDAHGGNGREVWIAPAGLYADFTWSPDSKRLGIVSVQRDASALEIVEVLSGKRRTLIGPEKKLGLRGLVWPNQDRLIVVIEEAARGINSPGTSSNLWEIRLSADSDIGLRPLTMWTDFPIRFGSLTTNGKSLALVRSLRQRDVYVAEIDPSRLRLGTPRRLTMDLSDDYPTAWTPDSKAVLFTSDRNGPSAIFRQETDSQTADQLVFGPVAQLIARAASGGQLILFFGNNGTRLGIMRAPMKGTQPEFLFEAANIMGLRCSRNGPCALAERRDGLMVVSEVDPVKGVKVREIYRDRVDGFGAPDLSPDGKWLATPAGTKIVFRSFATGRVDRELSLRGATDSGDLVSLDYAPDGKGFYAGQNAPTETRQLFIDLSGQATVLWRQPGGFMLWGVPSPNGRHLAMMMETDDSNVYTVEDF